MANRKTPGKIAIETYIQDIQKLDCDPLTKAALISSAKTVIREYCNQNDIVNIAIQFLQPPAKPEELEDDWIGKFMDKAKLVKSKEFQVIWGRILARECNRPGSIPTALLYTLEQMDREDAETFSSLCRVSVRLEEEYAPFIIGARFEEYKQLINVNYDQMVSLSALGLIEMDLGSSRYILNSTTLPAKVVYFDREYELQGSDSICVGDVIFTKTGQALCHSIEVEQVEGFWEQFCLPFWEKEREGLRL